MSTRDILNNLKYEQVLDPQAVTTAGGALDSGDIDTQGAESLAIIVAVGDISETLSGSAKLALKIEHADDDGTGAAGAYAACTDDDVLGFSSLAAGVFTTLDSSGEDEARYVIGYRGDKRFVKVTATPTGLTTGGPIAMLAVKGHLHQAPADNS